MNKSDGEFRIEYELRMILAAFALVITIITSIVCIANGEFYVLAGFVLTPAVLCLVYVAGMVYTDWKDLVRIYGRKNDTSESS